MNIDIIKNYIENKTWEKLEIINESSNNIIFGSKKYIYKFFDESKHRQYIFEKNILEILNNNKVYNIPNIKSWEKINIQWISRYLITMYRIEGVWIKYIRDSLDDAQKNQAIKDIIQIIKKIHKTKIIDENQWYKSINSWSNEVTKNIQKTQKASFFDEEYVNIIEEFLALYYANKKDYELALIHNDIRIANILYNQKNNKSYIIDFEAGLLGPKVFDFYRIIAQYYYAIEEKDKTEEDFTKCLIKRIIKEYPWLTNKFDNKLYKMRIYHDFISKSIKRENKRYNHEENKIFLQTMISRWEKWWLLESDFWIRIK